MTINITSKAVLLLSIVSLHVSMFGMLERAQNKISTLILSQKQQVAITILPPLTVVGCFLLVQNKDYVSSLLDNIPAPSEKVFLGLSTVIAMPTAYVLARKFSPEEQLELHHRNNTEIQKHLIFENKKKLTLFITGQEKVAFNEDEAPITLSRFINNKFGSQVNKGLSPSVNAANQLCDLESSIESECQRLQQIAEAKDFTWTAVKEEDVAKSITVPAQLAQRQKDLLFVQQFRAKVIELPEFGEYIKISPAIEKNKLTKDQISFGTKIAAFIPLFLPFVTNSSMILLQAILNKFGLPYRVI